MNQREIKFRAWDGKQMKPAFDLSQNPKYWWTENKDYPLMQYTGLKDNDGAEIYEGDIVHVGKELGVAIFRHGTFGYTAGISGKFFPFFLEHITDSNKISTAKIVGNIHENPIIRCNE